jgi:hypothetical protein
MVASHPELTIEPSEVNTKVNGPPVEVIVGGREVPEKVPKSGLAVLGPL